MSDEERLAKQRVRSEIRREKRESAKAEIREAIMTLAIRIPGHVRQGGVQAVHEWKRALDKAVDFADRSRISVDRLLEVAENLRNHVERTDEPDD